MATLTLTAAAQAAAQQFGALDTGNTLSATQISDALLIANELLDNWSNDRLMAEAVNLESVNTVGGTISYVLATRRAAVEAASIKTPAPSTPLTVVNAKEWSMIPDRGIAGSFIRLLTQVVAGAVDPVEYSQFNDKLVATAVLRYALEKPRPDLIDAVMRIALGSTGNVFQPRYLFYDRGLTTGTVYLAGAPQTGTMELLTWTAAAPFADATTPRTMEPGYARMLKAALAVEMAPQYDMPVTAELRNNYAAAMATIRQLNASLLGVAPATEAASSGTVTPAQ